MQSSDCQHSPSQNRSRLQRYGSSLSLGSPKLNSGLIQNLPLAVVPPLVQGLQTCPLGGRLGLTCMQSSNRNCFLSYTIQNKEIPITTFLSPTITIINLNLLFRRAALYFNHISIVFPLYFNCISTVFQANFHSSIQKPFLLATPHQIPYFHTNFLTNA